MSKSAAVFNKKKFINDVTETVRHMYRKQLKEASQQEILYVNGISDGPCAWK